MTLVRCRDHIIIKGDIHNYAAYATPLGFPDESAVICGRKHCVNPGLVLLNSQEEAEFEKGQRIFSLNTATAKVKVVEIHKI